MTDPKFPKPTESELDILQILWQDGPSSVRSVNDKLNDKREANKKEIGYTTTLKFMQLMLEKGFLDRDTSSRTHIYSAVINEAATQKQLVSKFIDRTFRGSAMKLVMQTLGNHKASSEELDEIKKLIEKMEKDK